MGRNQLRPFDKFVIGTYVLSLTVHSQNGYHVEIHVREHTRCSLLLSLISLLRLDE